MLARSRPTVSAIAAAVVAAFVAACGGSGASEPARSGVQATTADAPDAVGAATPGRALTLDLSVYIVDGESPALRSLRTIEDVRGIIERVNGIWAQAGIAFEVTHLARVAAPDEIMQALASGRVDAFLGALGREIPLERPSTLNVMYVTAIGGPNGIAPAGSRVALVIDEPSVDDERVTAHELGHHLGLHHVRGDAGRLLFSGTNGRTLSEEEAGVAMYVGRGLLDGVR